MSAFSKIEFNTYKAWALSAARFLRHATREEKLKELRLPEVSWLLKQNNISLLNSENSISNGIDVRRKIIECSRPTDSGTHRQDLWSYLKLRTPGMASPPTIHYAKDLEQANSFLSLLRGNVFGFDLEWNLTPVSVAQICDLEHIVIVHLAKMNRMQKSYIYINIEKEVMLTNRSSR